MNAFEILLDQDANLKLDEQQKVLSSLQSSYCKLQSSLSDPHRRRSMADGDVELQQQVAQLDTHLSQLATRVQVKPCKASFYIGLGSF